MLLAQETPSILSPNNLSGGNDNTKPEPELELHSNNNLFLSLWTPFSREGILFGSNFRDQIITLAWNRSTSLSFSFQPSLREGSGGLMTERPEGQFCGFF